VNPLVPLAATLAGVAAAAAVHHPAVRLPADEPPPGLGADPPAHTAPRSTRPAGTRAAGVGAAVATWVFVGGVPGVVGAALVGALLPIALGRLEPAAVRREREALVADAPLVADLMAACVAAGLPPERAIPIVGRAVGGPTRGALDKVQRRCDLAEPASSAWQSLSGTPGLSVIAQALARSSRTGAPLATVLASAAADLRAEAEAQSLARVRAAGVRAVLPLGLCLLPAFVLLGIAPIVGGLLPRL